MSRKSQEYIDNRRTFLKKLAAAGGATAAVAVTGRSAVAGTQTETVPETAARPSGYHETPHIHSYYRTARL
ncbi:MAG: formate dehydrogenase [Gammaproteobacteria bacterium]